jgi:hypothetical protein
MFERQRSLEKKSDIHQTHINWWVVMGAIERHTRTARSILFFIVHFSDGDDGGVNHFRHL